MGVTGQILQMSQQNCAHSHLVKQFDIVRIRASVVEKWSHLQDLEQVTGH